MLLRREFDAFSSRPSSSSSPNPMAFFTDDAARLSQPIRAAYLRSLGDYVCARVHARRLLRVQTLEILRRRRRRRRRRMQITALKSVDFSMRIIRLPKRKRREKAKRKNEIPTNGSLTLEREKKKGRMTSARLKLPMCTV